ncbi:MAG TPA: serine/threonine-protein kinase [Verrucomicrobiales bacterium]|nr:serine/threonine-protein kinase [Verrucomicrobiales bacterium]
MTDDFDFGALADAMHDTIVPPDWSKDRDTSGQPGAALRQFGDYLLEAEIARGGMGVVYRARQLALDRTVAVKVLRDTAFAGSGDVDRFKLEASAAAALRHPNIITIHEIGEHDDTHFFSMDHVAGSTLAHVLRDGPMPAKKAASLLLKIAGALHHAHSQGVLHRDLKPANVLLDAAGEPIVTDFGLAKHDAADMGLTLSGQVLGTPAYMAPEQAEGRSRQSDARTDVYGLGTLLYHMVTGRPPFAGDSHVAVMNQVLNDDPVSVRLLNPSISRDLGTICTKAMSKDMHRRYQTAQEMADDVQRFIDGKPVLARPLGSLGRAWRWARRHRVVAASLVIVVLALTAVAVISSVSAQRLKVSRDAEADARSAAETLIKDMLIGMRDKLRPLNKVELLDDAALAAEKYFDALPQPASARSEQQRAAMLETRSDVLTARNDLTGAIAKQRTSLEVLERLLQDDPHNNALLRDAAHAAQALAWLYKRQGRPSDALPQLARSHELHATLAVRDPAHPSVRHAAGLSACSYAEALASAGKKEDAWKLIEPLYNALREPGSTDIVELDRAAELHINLGDALWYAGHIKEANTEYFRALDSAEKTDGAQPGQLKFQRRLITSLERATDVHLEAKDYKSARDTSARRLAISEKLAAADPSNLQHRADVAAAQSRLALAARGLRDTAVSLDHTRKARATYESLAAADPSNLRHLYAIVTQCLDEAMLLKETDYPGAQLAYTRALEVSEKLLKANPTNLDYRRNVVIARLNESNLHLFHRNFPAARQSQAAATTANAAMLKDYPGNTRYLRDGERIANTLRDIEKMEKMPPPDKSD